MLKILYFVLLLTVPQIGAFDHAMKAKQVTDHKSEEITSFVSERPHGRPDLLISPSVLFSVKKAQL